MLYPYTGLPDEMTITHSETLENNSVLINSEQPYDDGLREARIELSSYKWLYNDGFGNGQIKFFVQFAHKNAAVAYRYARLSGISNA